MNLNILPEVEALAVTSVDPLYGLCDGSGWVTVHKDGATVQEKCPICNT